MKKKLYKLAYYGSLIWILNFVIFVIISMWLGGTALIGFIQNGSYYIGNHGNYTKVSNVIWYLNYIQGVLLFLLIPFPFIKAFLSAIDIDNKNK